MKGIVLETRNKDAAILTDDGVIRKIKNRNYELGEVVIMKEKRKNGSKLIKWCAGVAAAIVFSSTGAYAYYKPAGYVSLDINPSIEYSINMFDRVLEVKAFNEDAEEILAELKLKNMSIDKAIEQTTAKLINQNYISDNEDGNVIITTSGNDTEDAEELAEQLKQKIQICIDKEGKKAYIEAESVGLERVKIARELDVTPGKLNLVEKLIASSSNPDEIDIEEWLNKSPKEINKAIKDNRKASKNNSMVELDEDKLAEDEDKLDDDGVIGDKLNNDKPAIDEDENDEDENDEDENDGNEIEADENHYSKSQAPGLERVNKARELDVTPGKLNLVEKLIESSSNPDKIDMEEWLGKSVQEINEAIKENKKARKDSSTNNDDIQNANGQTLKEHEKNNSAKATQKSEKNKK